MWYCRVFYTLEVQKTSGISILSYSSFMDAYMDTVTLTETRTQPTNDAVVVVCATVFLILFIVTVILWKIYTKPLLCQFYIYSIIIIFSLNYYQWIYNLFKTISIISGILVSNHCNNTSFFSVICLQNMSVCTNF